MHSHAPPVLTPPPHVNSRAYKVSHKGRQLGGEELQQRKLLSRWEGIGFQKHKSMGGAAVVEPLLLLVAGGSGGGGGRCGVRLLLHRWLVCDAQVGHLLGGLGGGLGLWGHRGAGGWEEVGGEELVHLGGW